jgi:hypothetical protein
VTTHYPLHNDAAILRAKAGGTGGFKEAAGQLTGPSLGENWLARTSIQNQKPFFGLARTSREWALLLAHTGNDSGLLFSKVKR